MTSINTNVGALNARLYALSSTGKQQSAMERLSSGLRVNSAADDAAGPAVAGKMESQLPRYQYGYSQQPRRYRFGANCRSWH